MNFLKVFSIYLFIVFLAGCSKTPTIKYEPVYLPVSLQLDRPNRPIQNQNEKTSIYLIRVLGYTKKLENIIDTNNKNVK